MKTLPNGTTIFNATPHPITFWKEEWEPVTIETDEVIDAAIVDTPFPEYAKLVNIAAKFVTPRFQATEKGREIINRVRREHPRALIVGSIIAAQAYPQQVVAMTPAPGYERVPPAEKRMNPDKFTVY